MFIWQVGFGGVGVDFLAVVPFFPKPDAKIRTTEFKVFPSLASTHALFFPLSSIVVIILDAIMVTILPFQHLRFVITLSTSHQTSLIKIKMMWFLLLGPEKFFCLTLTLTLTKPSNQL